MKNRGKVIGIKEEPYFNVYKGKECIVMKFYWREGTPWFTLQDEQNNIFESPAKMWSNDADLIKKRTE